LDCNEKVVFASCCAARVPLAEMVWFVRSLPEIIFVLSLFARSVLELAFPIVFSSGLVAPEAPSPWRA
jgi:hypothetical protein